jgi:competence protein ComEC
VKKLWPLTFFTLAAGIILAYYQLWIIALCVILLLLLAGAICKRCSRQILLYILLMLGAIFYAHLRIPDLPSSLPVVQGFSCSGRIQDVPVVDGDTTTFILQTDRTSRWEKKIRVVCYFETNLSRGDQVSLRGVLKPPRRAGNPGEFNYPLYL